MSLANILKAVNKIIDLEEEISEHLKKEKDAKKRKKLRKACQNRDLAIIRDLLFKP
jgi:GTP1/Obg family GTP-binding protein